MNCTPFLSTRHFQHASGVTSEAFATVGLNAAGSNKKVVRDLE